MEVRPVVLEGHGLRLEPLGLEHVDGLKAAAADGALWTLAVTSVPEPDDTRGYVERALAMRDRLAFAVRESAGGAIVGSTSFHDIVPAIDRLEIGYTWYAKSRQKTFVNPAAKFLLMRHAFETLGAQLVGWRTDGNNVASQRAIERLGARKDGVLRHHAPRRDGSVRDTVMYSMTPAEWPAARAALEARLAA
jgi:RimJ/RimL family protein N-acetyltransferase